MHRHKNLRVTISLETGDMSQRGKGAYLQKPEKECQKCIKGCQKSTLSIHWKDWCWSWSSNILATWYEYPTPWKSPWWWKRLRAEGGNRGWDGWTVSPTLWTGVWASSGRPGRTGNPGLLQSMGLQKVGHDLTDWTRQRRNTRRVYCHRKQEWSSVHTTKPNNLKTEQTGTNIVHEKKAGGVELSPHWFKERCFYRKDVNGIKDFWCSASQCDVHTSNLRIILKCRFLTQ